MTLRLGDSNILLQPLCEYLGDDFVLESALVITVDPATEAQNAHTDTDAGNARCGGMDCQGVAILWI